MAVRRRPIGILSLPPWWVGAPCRAVWVLPGRRATSRRDSSRGGSLRLSGVRRMEQFLADESYLFNLVSGLAPRRDAVPGRHWRERYDEALSDEEYALQLNLALVRRMDTLCRQRDVSFLAAAFPDRKSYGVKPPLAERFFSSLEAEGITVLDMSVPFRAVGSRIRSVALDGTGHLGPLGHTLTAEVLERHLAALDQPAHRRPL